MSAVRRLGGRPKAPDGGRPGWVSFTPDTQRDYIRAVKKLAAFLGRSPDTTTAEDLRAFQLHLSATGVQPPTINATVTVLRFFFKVTLDRPETTRHLVFV
jgi:integrase/recombinase XerD